MKLGIMIVLFSILSTSMGITMANNIRITSMAYDDFKEESISNKNLKVAMNNIKTEIPDGKYQFKNVARTTLADGSLLCIESIELNADSFTEHTANIKYKNFTDLDIINNTLYPDAVVNKFVADKPEIEFNQNGTKLTKILTENRFEVFKKDYNNILVFR